MPMLESYYLILNFEWKWYELSVAYSSYFWIVTSYLRTISGWIMWLLLIFWRNRKCKRELSFGMKLEIEWKLDVMKRIDSLSTLYIHTQFLAQCSLMINVAKMQNNARLSFACFMLQAWLSPSNLITHNTYVISYFEMQTFLITGIIHIWKRAWLEIKVQHYVAFSSVSHWTKLISMNLSWVELYICVHTNQAK